MDRMDRLIANIDAVIINTASNKLISERLKSDSLTALYAQKNQLLEMQKD